VNTIRNIIVFRCGSFLIDSAYAHIAVTTTVIEVPTTVLNSETPRAVKSSLLPRTTLYAENVISLGINSIAPAPANVLIETINIYNNGYSITKPTIDRISKLKILNIGYINTYSSYKTDIYAEVKNENSLYRISNLDYYFSWDGGRSKTQSTFVEKGETKYLFSLGNDVSGISNLELVIDSINYDANLNDTGLFSSGNKRSDKLNIDTLDTSIKAVSSIKVLNYSVKNNSIYDYNNVIVYPVIFDSNNKPIFIYRNNIGKLLFKENKEFSINLPLNITGISKVGVFPELNLYVEDNYIY